MRTLAYVALRSLVIVVSTVVVTTLVAIAASHLPSARGGTLQDTFDSLGRTLLIGGTLGIAAGLTLAFRLGRRAFDGPDRVVQTLAALGLPFLILAAHAMG